MPRRSQSQPPQPGEDGAETPRTPRGGIGAFFNNVRQGYDEVRLAQPHAATQQAVRPSLPGA